MRDLLALPLRNGGSNIMTPDDRTNGLTWSKEVSQHLSDEGVAKIEYEQQKLIDSSPGKKVYDTTGIFTRKNLKFTLNYNFDDEESGGWEERH